MNETRIITVVISVTKKGTDIAGALLLGLGSIAGQKWIKLPVSIMKPLTIFPGGYSLCFFWIGKAEINRDIFTAV